MPIILDADKYKLFLRWYNEPTLNKILTELDTIGNAGRNDSNDSENGLNMKLNLKKMVKIQAIDWEYYYCCCEYLGLDDSDILKFNYLLDNLEIPVLESLKYEREKKETSENVEQIKCLLIHLPEILLDFQYVRCIDLSSNTGFQPYIKVRCECHTTLEAKRLVFKSLIKYLESMKHFITVETLAKLNKYFNYVEAEYGAFDSKEIRRLSFLLSGLMIDYSCSDCITCQSCWGHDYGLNTEPWIKFAVCDKFDG